MAKKRKRPTPETIPTFVACRAERREFGRRLFQKHLPGSGPRDHSDERGSIARSSSMGGLCPWTLSTWSGYAKTRWERDALVIHSNGFRDDLCLILSLAALRWEPADQRGKGDGEGLPSELIIIMERWKSLWTIRTKAPAGSDGHRTNQRSAVRRKEGGELRGIGGGVSSRRLWASGRQFALQGPLQQGLRQLDFRVRVAPKGRFRSKIMRLGEAPGAYAL